MSNPQEENHALDYRKLHKKKTCMKPGISKEDYNIDLNAYIHDLNMCTFVVHVAI